MERLQCPLFEQFFRVYSGGATVWRAGSFFLTPADWGQRWHSPALSSGEKIGPDQVSLSGRVRCNRVLKPGVHSQHTCLRRSGRAFREARASSQQLSVFIFSDATEPCWFEWQGGWESAPHQRHSHWLHRLLHAVFPPALHGHAQPMSTSGAVCHRFSPGPALHCLRCPSNSLGSTSVDEGCQRASGKVNRWHGLEYIGKSGMQSQHQHGEWQLFAVQSMISTVHSKISTVQSRISAVCSRLYSTVTPSFSQYNPGGFHPHQNLLEPHPKRARLADTHCDLESSSEATALPKTNKHSLETGARESIPAVGPGSTTIGHHRLCGKTKSEQRPLLSC